MKIQSTLFIGAGLLVGWQVSPAAGPIAGDAKETAAIAGADLEKASVTVPYSELKRLLLSTATHAAVTASESTKPPPVAGGLMAAALRLDCSGGRAALEAEFRVENFSGQWESIPLMGAGLAVASIDPPDSRVLAKDGQLCLATKTIGPATVTLRFVEREMPAYSDRPVIEADVLPCAVSTLEIIGLPEGRAAMTRAGDEVLSGSARGMFALPAKGGSISVTIQEPMKIAAEQAPPAPSDWSLQNEIAIVRDDGALRYTAHCYLTAHNGSGMAATISLPSNARQTKVEGEDLADWHLERAEGGRQALALRWKGRGVLEREVIVSYAVQQAPLDEQWNLAAPAAEQADKTKSLFVLAVPAVSTMEGQNLRQITGGAGLSKWMAQSMRGQMTAAIEGASDATVRVKPLPQAATADGTIKTAKYQTRIVADGSAITEASFEIEHEGSPRFALDLPADSALLKCSLNGQTTRPISGEGRRLEFQLPPSEGKSGKAEIVLSFTAAKGKLDPVSGKVSAELPLTPWFIHAIEWSLTLPDVYRISAVDGNIEYGAGTKAEHEVALRKSLCRGEAPKADLFYEKRGL
ncbi:MAG: hypothetical protein K1X78_08605 [Verrucomicrobiaceae bacterium]|nr:hypothetical protein [Verrucomicrobiaceae bacterium]